MVAKIKIGKSIGRIFYYNENKVKERVAKCLAAENYPFRLEKMNAIKKLNVLQKISSLRENLMANSVHISLNFAPQENFSTEKMKAITKDYMEQLGFGQQPYLLYQHQDAGHPHLHIVTTKVTMDGQVINTNNIGKVQSENARKSLEIKYDLVKAEDQPKQIIEPKSAYSAKIIYGKTESKKAIASVLNNVLNNYKFSSMPELNAVLNQYNVLADRGKEQSRTFKYGGLHYKILDSEGNPVGMPIKASLFAASPTLKNLEQKFKINDRAKQLYKKRTQNTIDYQLLANKKQSLKNFMEALKKEGVQVVLRQNKEGLVYGITYIDHRTRCVFNGSELGKNYSAKAILECCNINHKEMIQEPKTALVQSETESANHSPLRLIDELIQPEYSSNYIPYELRGKKNRKRRKH